MKFKFLILVITITCFTNCNSKEKNKEKETRLPTKSNTSINLQKHQNIHDDKAEQIEAQLIQDSINLFYSRENTPYLPLYKFDDDLIAVHYYEGENTSKFIDKLSNLIWEHIEKETSETISGTKDVSIVIENKYGIFYKYLPATKLFLEKYSDTYTVLCTKGVVERKFNDFYFLENECYGFELFLRVPPIDKTIYGEPIAMTISNDFMIEPIKEKEELTSFFMIAQDFMLRKVDIYREETKSFKLLGKHEEYYIGYLDDFKWKKNIENNKMNYPGRVFFKKVDNKFKIVKNHSLDLFGIPCD